MKTESKLDRLDRDILTVLQTDARISLQELSKQVGLSASPCWTRIRRMEEAGVIEGYTVRISAQAVGLAETVIVQVTLDSHSDEALFAFGRALADIPEVLEALLVSGDYDYILRIAVSDTRDYERLLRERLYKIPGLRHSKSSFVLRSLKQSALPLRR
jgi:Lrp/AsnC family leucine-responsive transcriptional regulator